MLYPFIYTRTKRHDFRVITSKSLKGLPQPIVQLATEIARASINATDNQLNTPTWILAKKDGYLLWGMAILNTKLEDTCKDKENRPVRGFFGFIADTLPDRLPYGFPYFKVLFDKFVQPVWDSYLQTEQIVGSAPDISGVDFIEKSSRLNYEINVDNSICRVFPSSSDAKALIEAVFSSADNCSIASNIHQKKQCVDFGTDKISFTNAVMTPDAKLSTVTDVKVFVPDEVPSEIPETNSEVIANNNVDAEAATDQVSEEPAQNIEDYTDETNNNQQINNNKYLKYILYGVGGLILLFALFIPTVSKKFHAPKRLHEQVEPAVRGHVTTSTMSLHDSIMETSANVDTMKLSTSIELPNH